jgi:hypothetical protein
VKQKIRVLLDLTVEIDCKYDTGLVREIVERNAVRAFHNNPRNVNELKFAYDLGADRRVKWNYIHRPKKAGVPAFDVGDLVRFKKEPEPNAIGKVHRVGRVVRYRGDHDPHVPRIRWNTGWGFHVKAPELVKLTESEAAAFPDVQLCEIDQ